MRLNQEFEPIREWAAQKGILDKGDPKTQTLKLLEEAGELAKAIINNDTNEVIDAIGDCVVVLTNIAALYSIHRTKNCKHCNGHGGYYEDVAGDGGSRMWQNCEECGEITIEECVNSAYEVISKRTGKMEDGTFKKDI